MYIMYIRGNYVYYYVSHATKKLRIIINNKKNNKNRNKNINNNNDNSTWAAVA